MMDAYPRSSDASIAVWIVEDNRNYRDTFVYMLNHTSGLRCTQVFYDYEEVKELVNGSARWEDPDVVLMDVGLPGMSGIEGVSHLKARLPEVPILMLTIHDEEDFLFEALRAGASGYLLKDTPVDEIILAVRKAHQGGTLMVPSIAEKVLQHFRQTAPARAYHLTPREKEVLELMAEGLVQKQIADALSVSPHTVDNHVRHIYRKLHVNSGIEAVAKAVRERLI